jgi:Fe-Mn family superoxide dismutase
MGNPKAYVARDFSRVRGLAGISSAQIEEHLQLYAGYVKRTNALTDRLGAMASEGGAAGSDPVYAELTRRLGFEYNGMILHEHYFGNLAAGAQAEPPAGGKLRRCIEASFGKYDTWLADFRAIAAMPGVGWATTYQDPGTGWLSNHWITLHSDGNPSGFAPVLVMDGWEHAFMRDYLATERPRYVDAFFRNVDWAACERRLRWSDP